MNLRRTYAIALRHAYLVRGSISRLMPMFSWVLVDMVLWGFITKFLNHVTQSGYNFVAAMLGAVLLWDFYIRVMQGVTMAFFEDVWSRNFLNVFASPIRISEYVSGLVVSSIATSSVGLGVMLLVTTTVFGLSFFAYGIALLPFFLVLFTSGIALGIAAAGMVLRLGPASEWFVWPIPALLSPFAGVFYPLSTLPVWMQYIGRALPPAYVFEAMRAIVGGGAVDWSKLAISIAMSAGHVVLASWYFTAMYRQAVRTGLIARYSAESIS